MRRQLSPAGRQAVDDMANRHGFSADATRVMLEAVDRGGGRMAQFDHPEFAGSGQWMIGGMTMVSDLSDQRLKRRIDALCSDLSRLLEHESGSPQGGSRPPSQPRGAADRQLQDAGGPPDGGSTSRRFESATAGEADRWWPAGLHAPSSSGAQNDMRYAWFADQRRLAIDCGGRVTVYDTQDHRIGGVSQQQSAEGSLRFTSQHGSVDLRSLPVVSSSSPDAAPSPSGCDTSPPPRPQEQEQPRRPAADTAAHDVFRTIERLADLHAKGLLSDEEFAAKKKELLARI